MKQLNCVVIGWLAILFSSHAYGDDTYSFVITNNSGKAIKYAVRKGENTGQARPYKTIEQANGTKQTITYSSSADYGVVFRVPPDERQWGRSLFATFGPYEIKADGKVYDRQGKEIPETRKSD